MNARACDTWVISGLAVLVVAHAVGHPFDHPHTHTPAADENEPLLGKLVVVSSSTGRRAYVDSLEPGRYGVIGSPLSSSTSRSSNSTHN